jgi:hypothetical protein
MQKCNIALLRTLLSIYVTLFLTPSILSDPRPCLHLLPPSLRLARMCSLSLSLSRTHRHGQDASANKRGSSS